MAEGDAVDAELATAINMADGDTAIPGAGPPAGPHGLTPTQRAGDTREQQLLTERTRTRAELDHLQRRLARMLTTDRDRDSETPDALAARIRAARGRLADLDAIDQALGDAPETYLAQLDIPADYAGRVRAAVAVGNPDTAGNITITVPGLGAAVRTSLPEMTKEAASLRNEAAYQLQKAGRPGSVASIAWVGYDPPPNPLATVSPRDAWAAIGDGQARAGAASLSSYLEQVRAGNPSAQARPDAVRKEAVA